MKEAKAEFMEEVSELVDSILVPGKLVHKVLSVVVSLSNCERAAVLVMLPGNKLEVKAQTDVSPGGLNFIRDLCNTYWDELMKSSSLVYIADTRKDEKFRKISVLKGSDILSFACVQLKVESSTYGILYLDSTTTTRLFSSLDLERISRYSRLITNALIREDRLTEVDLRIPVVSINDYLAERTIDEIEKQQLNTILVRNHWNVTRASQVLDLPRRTLYNKMIKHGIRRPRRGKLGIPMNA